MTPEQYLDTWTKLLLRGVLVAILLAFLFFIRDVVLLFFIAIIITASAAPAIEWLEKFRIPRVAAVLGVYFLAVGIFGTIIGLFVPVFTEQIREFSKNIPLYLERFSIFVDGFGQYFRAHNMAADIDSAGDLTTANSSVSGIFSTTVGIVRAMFSVIVVFFLSLYMSFERNGIEKVLVTLTPAAYESRVLSLAKRIRSKISQWMFAQLLLMCFVFSLYFIGLSLLGIPYALLLALFGGLLEMIPFAGPTMAAIPAVLLGFISAPWLGFVVILFYVLVQQVENHIVIPQVMKRTVGLNPVAVIVALLIGAKLAGIAGILLAVPGAAALSVFLEDFLGNSRKGDKIITE